MDPNPGRSLKAQARRADQLRSRHIVFLGEEEVRNGVLNVRNLHEGRQWEVPASAWERLLSEEAHG
jgi:histidyl-tRNA synthetase